MGCNVPSKRQNIDQLLDSIGKAKTNNQFRPYIDYIYFPHYKNLEPFTQIDFDFPITVLIGANGTNKSSILKALEACCPRISLGNRWFSTQIDPIRHRPNVPCFVYGYEAIKGTEVTKAQVLYTKYFRNNDPDYWEPAKAVAKYNMDPVSTDPAFVKKWGLSKQRWPKIPKNKPVYLTFRDSISAFDKFYYYGDAHPGKSDIKDRRKTIRRYSRALNHVIKNNLKSHTYMKKERVKNNEILSAKGLEYVSYILATHYEEIKLVHHTFYNCEGYTCKFKRNSIEYSEAFAGSGEYAVIRIVKEILNAENFALILLDEPEVSLHPGAQEKLMEFIVEQTLAKKLQVIIATHSPALIRSLPHNSIKVLLNDHSTNTTKLLKQSCPPSEAFFHIGEPSPDKITIIVEDKLAEALIKYAIEDLPEAQRSLLEINYYGGSSSILQSFGISNAIAQHNNIHIYLDGDQTPANPLKPIEDLTEGEILNTAEILNKMFNCKLVIPKDSNENEEKIKKRNKRIYSYFKNNIHFLPSNQIPEGFIWEKSSSPMKSLISNSETGSYKERFEQLSKELLPESSAINSDKIFTTQLMLLKYISKQDPDLESIKQNISHLLSTL
ncbi:hypothetical protein OTEC02_12655 [Acinetobacter lactucae]|nr:hypothetical protein OTEC02_12655 [Acinetobacter lactucae]SSQ98006.1 Predicted ATP-binding protein involved in virulence [Acinetobacter baumannii]